MPSLKSSALPLLVVLLFGYSLEYLQSKDVQITGLVSQRYILLEDYLHQRQVLMGSDYLLETGPDVCRLLMLKQ